MILSIEEYRQINPNDATADSVLKLKLQAIESAVRGFTNNNFQRRNIRFLVSVVDGELTFSTSHIAVGNSIQITESQFNDGLYNVLEVGETTIAVEPDLIDEENVLVTKVVYPPDVKMGIANLLKWDYEQRGKIGIKGESLSRHSVTYSDINDDNSTLGYPSALTGFLKPYMKARF